MGIFKTIMSLFNLLIQHPLSILRFGLSILMGKRVLAELDFIIQIQDNRYYELSSTWFLSILPNGLFNFDYNYITYKYVILCSAILAAIGILGRVNLLILSFFSFFILGVSEGVGIFDHHLSLPTQVLLVLALIPGSMQLSIDCLIIKIYNHFKNKKTISFTNNSKWGFNLILGLVALTYFTAGISKIRYGGINWLDGSTLGFYLKERTDLQKKGDVQLIIGSKSISEEKKWKDKFGFIAHTYANYQTSNSLLKISNYVANNKILLILLSIGSVLFELLAFIVFINSKYRNIYLFSAIAFHLSIGALMGISFRQYRLICLCLIDWNLILNYLKNKSAQIKFFRLNSFLKT